MMKMFLGDASHTVHLTLPRKIKRTTIPGAKVEGKQLTAKASLLELAEGKVSLDGGVWFR